MNSLLSEYSVSLTGSCRRPGSVGFIDSFWSRTFSLLSVESIFSPSSAVNLFLPLSPPLDYPSPSLLLGDGLDVPAQIGMSRFEFLTAHILGSRREWLWRVFWFPGREKVSILGKCEKCRCYSKKGRLCVRDRVHWIVTVWGSRRTERTDAGFLNTRLNTVLTVLLTWHPPPRLSAPWDTGGLSGNKWRNEIFSC